MDRPVGMCIVIRFSIRIVQLNIEKSGHTLALFIFAKKTMVIMRRLYCGVIGNTQL